MTANLLVRAAIYAAALIVALLVAPRAKAQSACLPSPEVAKMLKDTHGEVPALQLIRGDGSIFTLYVRPGGNETWTMTFSPPGMPEIQCPTGLSGAGATRPG